MSQAPPFLLGCPVSSSFAFYVKKPKKLLVPNSMVNLRDLTAAQLATAMTGLVRCFTAVTFLQLGGDCLQARSPWCPLFCFCWVLLLVTHDVCNLVKSGNSSLHRPS